LASDPRELDEPESVDGFDDVEPEDPEPEDPEPEDPEPEEEEESEDEDSDPDDEPELEDAASFVFSLDLPFDDPARLSVL
jgi:hypothetical protein